MPGVRLRTLADVFARAAAHGIELRSDATKTQVRRPRAHRAGRRAFVSGKRKQNTIKATTVCDGRGRTLWAGARQSSGRICVEHAIAEHKQWRPLQRYLGRREAYAEVYLAIASLVSDRAARRSIRG